jgi:mycoredoxin
MEGTVDDQMILMYGTTWCGDCRRSKRVLEGRGVPYRWINIEDEEGAAEEMLRLSGGRQSVPTIRFPDGRVLVEPSDQELTAQLEARRPG